MNTVMTWQTRSTSSEATEQLGTAIGAKLQGGEVLELVSDLGGGKTTFTRGLARGAGSNDTVGSPTFTISKQYEAAHCTIVHFDFYRLAEAGIVADELTEFIADPHYAVVVEWGEIVHDVLPEDRVTISLQQTPEGDRDIIIKYPENRSYLLENLT